MPSEPRTEPTLEELSAYLDHELDTGDHARVAEHVATCSDCQSRLDGLRQTAYAVRALPQETPPRAFTIPQAQRRRWNWAPAGWIGGVAAAMVIVIVGVTHIPSPGATTASSSKISGGLGQGAPYTQPYAPAAGSANQDRNFSSTKGTVSFPNSTAIIDPTNSVRRLVLGADGSSYPANATMRVRIILEGDPSPSIDASAQGVSLVLVRNGSGVALRNLTGTRAYGGPPVFDGSYAIASLPLTKPASGTYTLIATWSVPDGSGRVLQASIPVTISAG